MYIYYTTSSWTNKGIGKLDLTTNLNVSRKHYLYVDKTEFMYLDIKYSSYMNTNIDILLLLLFSILYNFIKIIIFHF